jgi:prolipoprotein diacylglyceryltransferase
MLPFLHLPLGRGLGALLLLIAAAAWWLLGRSGLARYAKLALLPLGLGIVLVIAGDGLGAVDLPLYGLCMLVGTLVALVLGARFGLERGLPTELVVECAIVGMVCGLAGGRLVHVIEQWGTKFSDAPPGRKSPGPLRPLAAGDALALRTHAGAATFTGDETTPAAVLARSEEQARAADVTGRLDVARHRGPAGLEERVRGLVLRTGKRGGAAWLEVAPGPAQVKLGLDPGRTVGKDVPLIVALGLGEGGLTYFGAALGVLLGWGAWLRWRRLPALAVLDALCPVLPLGLFFGRLGCLARGCCFGREAGEHALLTVRYPPCSLPWEQMAVERTSLAWDPALQLSMKTGAVPPGLAAELGPLAQGTPPMHAAQLYEGLGVLLIFGLLVLYRRRWQRAVGQCFLLMMLLQAPLRFVVEHLRRDHDVFLAVAGYPLTESQIVAILFVAVAAPWFVLLQRRGQPVSEAPPLVPPAAAKAAGG